MACNALCCCFSGEPLRADETEKGRAGQYKKYVNYVNKFQISMGDAPYVVVFF